MAISASVLGRDRQARQEKTRNVQHWPGIFRVDGPLMVAGTSLLVATTVQRDSSDRRAGHKSEQPVHIRLPKTTATTDCLKCRISLAIAVRAIRISRGITMPSGLRGACS